MLKILDRARRIITPEFDETYYRERYKDEVSGEKDLISHYLTQGRLKGYNPAPWFDARAYLALYPDVSVAGMEPFFHYISYGRREGRALPTSSHEDLEIVRPHFDVTYYKDNYSDIPDNITSDDQYIFHYLSQGWKEGKDPSPNFSTTDYLNLNADVRLSPVNPYKHYLANGRFEGRVGKSQRNRGIEPSQLSPSVLFVGHSGNPAGAELMLAEIIEWYADHTTYNIDILILSPGVLVNKYQRFGNVYCLGEGESLDNVKYNGFLRERYDYIYLNTVVSGRFGEVYASKYQKSGVPLIMHVHEMAGVIKEYEKEFSTARSFVTSFVAASTAVKDDLINEFHIPDDKIFACHSFIRASAKLLHEAHSLRRDARKELGCGDAEFIVVGCGTVYPRKGPDLFLNIAEKALKNAPAGVKFVWIGEGPDRAELEQAVSEKGLHGLVEFVGYKENARQLVAAGDLFLLSSREDPFPLVCLEAASYGIPTLFFEGTSGIIALTRNGGGFCVPSFDVDSAAQKITYLLSNRSAGENAGLEARKRFFASYELSESCRALFLYLRNQLRIKPSVSVIVPNFNHAAYLRQRLDSIVNQTLNDIEIIILDDASTDDSRNVIAEYSDPRIITAYNEQQSGSPFAQWKLGLSLSSSDRVWIAESDDYCDYDFLAITQAGLSDGIAVSYCATEIVNSEGVLQPGVLDEYLDGAEKGRYKRNFMAAGGDEVNSAMAFRCTIVNASAAIFQRDLLERAIDASAGFKMCGDWMVYLHLLQMGGVSYNVDTRNYFRRHAHSTVSRLEGTDVYFEERSKIAEYVADNFHLDKRAARRVVLDLENEWNRFSKIEKSKSSLNCYLNLSKFWDVVNAQGSLPAHVAFYVHGMLFSKGGIERQCADLAKFLANRGIKVTIFCRVWGQKKPVFDVGRFVDIVPVFDENNAQATTQALRKELVERNVEIFVPMLSEFIFEHMAEAIKDLNIRSIASEHNDPWMIEKLWWDRDRRVKTLSEFDRIHLLLDKFVETIPESMRDKVTVIPNASSDHGLVTQATGQAPVFVAVGRLVHQKGFDRLISAMSFLVRQVPDAELRIFGEGPEKESLSDLADRLGVADHVSFMGVVPSIAFALKDAVALVVPSRFEGFGIVVVEAKLAGVPAIAFEDCNGPSDLITDGFDGIISSPFTTGAELASAMKRIWSDSAQRKSMSENARQSGLSFTPQVVFPKWISLFQDVSGRT